MPRAVYRYFSRSWLIAYIHVKRIDARSMGVLDGRQPAERNGEPSPDVISSTARTTSAGAISPRQALGRSPVSPQGVRSFRQHGTHGRIRLASIVRARG